MNPLASLYLQAVLQSKQTEQKTEKQLLKLEQQEDQNDNIQKKNQSTPVQNPNSVNIQYLQKQQLFNLIQQKQKLSVMEQFKLKFKFKDYYRNDKIITLTSVQQSMAIYLKQQIELKETILKIHDQYHKQQLPFVIRITANIILHALLNVQDAPQNLIQQYQQNPLSINISHDLWKTTAQIIVQHQIHLVRHDESNLFEKQQDNLVYVVSQMVIFREEFNEKIFNNLHAYQVDQDAGLVAQFSLNHLHQFVVRYSDDVWTTFIYKLFNYDRARMQSLTKQQCLLSFAQYTALMNQYFKKTNLIIKAVEQSGKDTRQIHNDKIFQEYLMIMSSFKASTQDFFKNMLTYFFSDDKQEQPLELIEFSQKTIDFHKSQNNELMFILPRIIQLETQLLDFIYSQQINEIKVENQLNNSNYYLKMIQKLKIKCVYNGEDQCECKKCLCIRRNRSSARESQKKKKDALVKIGPLQENYEQLKKKVHTLEEENELLRGLLIDVFKHPALQLISSQFIEPLTKVISSCSEDFVQKTSYLSEC